MNDWEILLARMRKFCKDDMVATTQKIADDLDTDRQCIYGYIRHGYEPRYSFGVKLKNLMDEYDK